jgi:hypothetical protein
VKLFLWQLGDVQAVVSEFKWWEVLDDDFHFRDGRFEDGVVLSKHEPHNHTAS